MILDHINNIKNYKGISKNMDTAIEYILENELSDLDVGKYAVDEKNVFYMIQEYETKDIEEGNFEAHDKYIDIQYVLNGDELIGYAPRMFLNTAEEYDASKDKIILKGKEERHRLTEGMFAIYFPEDGHMPSINMVKTTVKKAVFKIKI